MKNTEIYLRSMGFFRIRGSNIVHLVAPESPDGPFSATAICGHSAKKETPFPRYVYGDNGERVFTGMGTIVSKSVEGWIPTMNPNGVTYKLCKRCHRAHTKAVKIHNEAVLNDPVIRKNLETQWETRPV